MFVGYGRAVGGLLGRCWWAVFLLCLVCVGWTAVAGFGVGSGLLCWFVVGLVGFEFALVWLFDRSLAYAFGFWWFGLIVVRSGAAGIIQYLLVV